MCAQSASAQTIHTSFEQKSSGKKIEGKLLAVSDDSYTIATQAGRVFLAVNDANCTGRACPLHGAPDLPPVATNMQRIELSALGGMVDIAGKVAGFVDDHYIVDVPQLGLIRLKRAGLRCSGPGCRIREMLALKAATQPAVAKPAAAPSGVVPIIGERELTEGLLPALLKGFATSQGSAGTLQRLSPISYSVPLGENGSIFVGATGSDATFGAFTAGGADFAVAWRPLSEKDVSDLRKVGIPDLRNTPFETVLSVESIDVAINPAIEIGALNFAQLAAIYRGEITNWSELGGPNADIAIIHRQVGSAARAVFNDVVLGGDAAPPARDAIIATSTQQMARLLNETPYSIGYLRSRDAAQLPKIDLVGACGLTAVSSEFSRMAEDAPMRQRIYLYSAPDPATRTGQEFHVFARSPRADAALSSTSFDGFEVLRKANAQRQKLLDPADLGNNAQRALSNQLTSKLDLWDRLSTTFRFAQGATSLGQKENDDIERLINHLETLPQGAKVMLTGFTDTSGDFDTNLQLAGQRAQLVARAMTAAAQGRLSNLEIAHGAYGELMPIACNDTAHGRAVNRRVEVWINRTDG